MKKRFWVSITDARMVGGYVLAESEDEVLQALAAEDLDEDRTEDMITEPPPGLRDLDSMGYEYEVDEAPDDKYSEFDEPTIAVIENGRFKLIEDE